MIPRCGNRRRGNSEKAIAEEPKKTERRRLVSLSNPPQRIEFRMSEIGS